MGIEPGVVGNPGWVVGNPGWVVGNLKVAEVPGWDVGIPGLVVDNLMVAEILGRDAGSLRVPECPCWTGLRSNPLGRSSPSPSS